MCMFKKNVSHSGAGGLLKHLFHTHFISIPSFASFLWMFQNIITFKYYSTFVFIYLYIRSYFKIHRLLKLLLQNVVYENMILFWKLHRKSHLWSCRRDLHRQRGSGLPREWRGPIRKGSGSISSPWGTFLYFFYWLQDKFWDMRISLQHIKAYQRFYLKLIRLTMETLSSSWILLEYFVIRHPP